MSKQIVKFRWLILSAWVCTAVALAVLGPKPDPTPGETSELLPADTPAHIALNTIQKHFGGNSAVSSVVIGFERKDTALTPDDLTRIESFAKQLLQPLGDDNAADFNHVSLRTPALLMLAGKANPLISNDGHAALVTLSLPFNYITKQAARIARHVQHAVADSKFPSGLTPFVTGSAGYGYDYDVATEKSHDKTAIATVLAVVLILLAVYRAPLAALVPLVGVSLAAFIVIRILLIFEKVGLHGGMAEQIFTFVLLYGAGIDYSLLVISRYREHLNDRLLPDRAIALGLQNSMGAIVCSATITISGLAMLCFARFSVFRNSGPAVVLALATAALAAVTLIPALIAIVGPALFWTIHFSKVPARSQHFPRFWTPLARIVVAHPRWVMLLTLLALILPAIRGANVSWNYDALFSLKSGYPSRQGTEMIDRHWPTGEIAPVTLVFVTDKTKSPAAWASECDALHQALLHLPEVENIRSLNAPLGLQVDPSQAIAIKLLAGDRIRNEYLSSDGLAMRLTAILNVPPLSRSAMNAVDKISKASALVDPHIQLSGLTAEMIDLRSITHDDFYRIASLSVCAILIIVIAVLHDIALGIFIVAATALSYLTTLGLSYWAFHLFGVQGIEWKVQMLLFIVLVAVGQDYSIFFTLRYAQEAASLPCKQAVEKAIIFTGPVISSCGLIMAATLGSIATGDVKVLVQLGFAFALGMLIDTFIVRPLLLPAFIVITGRTLHRAAKVG